MGIQVLERFVEGKTDDGTCEDMIVVTDHFAAVIDGASDATGARFAGKTGGRFAAEVVAATIASLPATADARAFADVLADALTQAVEAAQASLVQTPDGPSQFSLARPPIGARYGESATATSSSTESNTQAPAGSATPRAASEQRSTRRC